MNHLEVLLQEGYAGKALSCAVGVVSDVEPERIALSERTPIIAHVLCLDFLLVASTIAWRISVILVGVVIILICSIVIIEVPDFPLVGVIGSLAIALRSECSTGIG